MGRSSARWAFPAPTARNAPRRRSMPSSRGKQPLQQNKSAIDVPTLETSDVLERLASGSASNQSERQSELNGGEFRMRRAVLPILAACFGIGWWFGPQPARSHELISTTVLFDREIVRILNKRCVGCHSKNNLAFPLTTYEETRPWARAIQEEALRRHMPPWRAVPGYSQFANDNGLTLREFAFIVSWVEGNGPKSAGQTVLLNVAETPKGPGDVAIKPDFERWQLGEPDLQRQLATNTIAPGQPDEIRRSVVDLG